MGKKSSRPYGGISVTSRGIILGLMDEKREADIYSLEEGDIVRICVDYLFDSSDSKDFSTMQLFFNGYRFGKAKFLANYQSGLVEYRCSVNKMRVMEGSRGEAFVILDKINKREKKLKENSRAYRKGQSLMNLIGSLTEPADWY